MIDGSLSGAKLSPAPSLARVAQEKVEKIKGFLAPGSPGAQFVMRLRLFGVAPTFAAATTNGRTDGPLERLVGRKSN